MLFDSLFLCVYHTENRTSCFRWKFFESKYYFHEVIGFCHGVLVTGNTEGTVFRTRGNVSCSPISYYNNSFYSLGEISIGNAEDKYFVAYTHVIRNSHY